MLDDQGRDERRWARWLLRFFEPQVKAFAWAGFADLVLVEVRDPRDGRRRRHVTGLQVDGTQGWALYQAGRQGGELRLIAAEPHVRVRVARRWRSARAEALPDDDPQARLDTFGPSRFANAVRTFGITDQVTVHFLFT